VSSYEEIAAKAREAEPYLGVLLRYQKDEAQIVCQQCGPLPPTWERHGWTSDWLHLAGDAMQHSKDTGHYAAVTLSHWAIYGPDPDEEGTEKEEVNGNGDSGDGAAGDGQGPGDRRS
jgi:hypothetical protein